MQQVRPKTNARAPRSKHSSLYVLLIMLQGSSYKHYSRYSCHDIAPPLAPDAHITAANPLGRDIMSVKHGKDACQHSRSPIITSLVMGYPKCYMFTGAILSSDNLDRPCVSAISVSQRKATVTSKPRGGTPWPCRALEHGDCSSMQHCSRKLVRDMIKTLQQRGHHVYHSLDLALSRNTLGQDTWDHATITH